MHRRWAAAVLGTVALAATGCGGSDAPALAGPPEVQPTPAAAPPGSGGPAIAVTTLGAVEEAVVHPGPGTTAAAAAAITAGSRSIANGLARAGRDCPVTVERSDAHVVSLLWSCTDHHVATGTWSVADGAALSLSGVLAGAWASYLTNVASVQLAAGGLSSAEAATAAATVSWPGVQWYLTPGTLDVTFPLPGQVATVAYPLGTLAPFLPAGSPATPLA